MSNSLQALQWAQGRYPAVMRAGTIAAITCLLLSSCGEESRGAQEGPSASVNAAVPDACGLINEDFLTSLLGDETGPPKPEGDDGSERRSCTWMAPSDEHSKASLIIHIASEGLRGISDRKARSSRTRQLFEKRILQGTGTCKSFSGPDYQGCWSVYRTSLLIDLLKEDRIVSAVITSPAYKSSNESDLVARARSLADHVTARL